MTTKMTGTTERLETARRLWRATPVMALARFPGTVSLFHRLYACLADRRCCFGGKRSSVRSRESCASTGRLLTVGALGERGGNKVGASSRMTFHSPGGPPPLTALRNPGGGSLIFASLKSNTFRAPQAGQASNDSARVIMFRCMSRQSNKIVARDKEGKQAGRCY